MFYVYIIKSTVDGNLYTGSTNDLKRRLFEHNNYKNRSTKSRSPFLLCYYEAYRDESEARNREFQLKKDGKALGQLKRRITKSLL